MEECQLCGGETNGEPICLSCVPFYKNAANAGEVIFKISNDGMTAYVNYYSYGLDCNMVSFWARSGSEDGVSKRYYKKWDCLEDEITDFVNSLPK